MKKNAIRIDMIQQDTRHPDTGGRVMAILCTWCGNEHEANRIGKGLTTAPAREAGEQCRAASPWAWVPESA